MISIETTATDGKVMFFDFNKVADLCPFCHNSIEPIILKAYIDRRIKEFNEGTVSQVIFKCPRNKCGNIFIGVYEFIRDRDSQYFQGPIFVYPEFSEEKIFSDLIKNISSNFVKIYNQAYSAEQHNLDLIAGPGYRKALEFLIKDYSLLKSDEDKIEEIRNKSLGEVINLFIDDPRIKSISKRAVWLGNDETHYLRKWEGKDLEALKLLIGLTVRWIEMVELSEEYEKDMPE